jgi:hypothetical protein
VDAPFDSAQGRPELLSGRAAENLRYIRQAMERGTTFTSIPGIGGAVMGGVALVASGFAARQPSGDRWLPAAKINPAVRRHSHRPRRRIS